MRRAQTWWAPWAALDCLLGPFWEEGGTSLRTFSTQIGFLLG